MTALLLVCAGAAVGAPARYLTDRAVQSRHDSLMPWGTLAVNVIGSLVLGLLIGLTVVHDLPEAVTLGVGTGFCGALTTYSTFSYETLRLLESRAVLVALANVGVSLVAGLAAALGGYALGTTL
ncbi:fluoride efflux transporter CrcB [Intrasporangium sp. YIM S08009]|uniref:fluoride efflux transporter CrcB n=1 Tax=Intrasporangium zincisolvens TaxID=3080018 RepID=UPI002B05CD0C|nr:fluoride efflux transporter CrcB [Intrasporangium sp. YIM S08009]